MRAKRRRRTNGGSTGRSGHSVLEVLIAFVMLCAGLLGFGRAIGSSMSASSASHEATRAREAAREMLESIGTVEFSEIFARYNDEPADDPDGPGTAAGPDFAVDGLDLSVDDNDGFAGEVILPSLDAAPRVLREDLNDARLGLPRDLNGDGLIDNLDHADDYLLLPITVRIEWRGSTGSSQIELHTMLGNVE